MAWIYTKPNKCLPSQILSVLKQILVCWFTSSQIFEHLSKCVLIALDTYLDGSRFLKHRNSIFSSHDFFGWNILKILERLPWFMKPKQKTRSKKCMDIDLLAFFYTHIFHNQRCYAPTTTISYSENYIFAFVPFAYKYVPMLIDI